jgi:hypothetical protein
VGYSDISLARTAFDEVSNALAVVKLPTDYRPQCPPAFLSFCSSLLSLCLFPAFRKEISRQGRLETTIAISVDPLHPRFCPASCAFLFPQVDRCRHRIACNVLAENAKALPN